MIINDNVATQLFFNIVCTSKLWDNNIVSKKTMKQLLWHLVIKAHLEMQ